MGAGPRSRVRNPRLAAVDTAGPDAGRTGPGLSAQLSPVGFGRSTPGIRDRSFAAKDNDERMTSQLLPTLTILAAETTTTLTSREFDWPQSPAGWLLLV